MDIYNKSGINKINQIRKRLRSEFGQAPALNDPRLMDAMLDYWVDSRDAITKSEIRKLMEYAGDPWQSRYAALVVKHTL